MRTAYKYDENGGYVGAVTLYESPREPGVFPMPANTTLLQPTSADDLFIDGEWVPQLTMRTLELVASEKIDEITDGFNGAVSGQFEVNGLTFDHGINSILKIFLAIEKSRKNDEQTRILYESDETPHEMNMVDAEAIAIAIGNDYDIKDARMRIYKKQVTDILNGGSADQEKVDAIKAITISYEVE